MRRIGMMLGVVLLVALALADRTTVSVSNLQAHVKYLSSPELEGRFAIAPGAHKAADYIARVFEQSGLEPKGTNGYFQDWELTLGFKPGADNSLKIRGGRVWEAPAEAIRPLNLTANTKVEGELVFVGYGISQPNAGYDDYANGRCLGQDCGHPARRAELGGRQRRHHNARRASPRKCRPPCRRGAVGVILVNLPDSDRLLPLGMRGRAPAANAALLNVQASVGDKLLQPLGLTVAEAVERINEKGLPISAPLNATAEVSASIEPNRGVARNVVGFIPGSDPALRDEVIVIGAHYDHLGYGEVGSLAPEPGDIHPGADDNASGTAAIMELARLLAQNRDRLKRSVLVIAFSAEEEGLLGAEYFVQNPTVPRENIVAMLNFDMVGRMSNNRVSVSGVGTAAEWEGILKAANSADLSLQLGQSASGGSDHMPFMRREIPVLFFFTGMHPDYHRPSDTWEKINYEGQAQIVGVGGARGVRPRQSPGATQVHPPPAAATAAGRAAERIPRAHRADPVLLRAGGRAVGGRRARLARRASGAEGRRPHRRRDGTAHPQHRGAYQPLRQDGARQACGVHHHVREGKELKLQVTPAAP
jgi:aminopeptidase YwaD